MSKRRFIPAVPVEAPPVLAERAATADYDVAERKRLARIILDFLHEAGAELAGKTITWDPARLNLILTAIVDELPGLLKADDRLPFEEKVALHSMIVGIGRGMDSPEVREMFLTQDGFERFWALSMVAVSSLDRFCRYIALESDATLSPSDKERRRKAVLERLDLHGTRPEPP